MKTTSKHNILDIPFLELDIGVDIDVNKLKSEFKAIEEKYVLKPPTYHDYMSYVKTSWIKTKLLKLFFKIYASFIPVTLIYFTKGLSYEGDMYFGNEDQKQYFSDLKIIAPYMFSIIEKIYGNSPKSRIQLATLKPKRSLIWHSHLTEEPTGWDINNLIIQIPIICPKGSKYCVVSKDEFGSGLKKRFWPRSWFKSLKEREFEEGKAFNFNGYHYHNVYNTSNEPRTVIIFQVNARHDHIRKLFKRSLKKQNNIDKITYKNK